MKTYKKMRIMEENGEVWLEKKEPRHTPPPQNMKVVDLGKEKGVISSTRFAIMADSNIPGHQVVIAQGPYKPHAEMFVHAVKAHEDLVKALKRIRKALTQNSGPEARSTFEMCQLIQDVTEEALAKAEGRS